MIVGIQQQQLMYRLDHGLVIISIIIMIIVINFIIIIIVFTFSGTGI